MVIDWLFDQLTQDRRSDRNTGRYGDPVVEGKEGREVEWIRLTEKCKPAVELTDRLRGDGRTNKLTG